MPMRGCRKPRKKVSSTTPAAAAMSQAQEHRAPGDPGNHGGRGLRQHLLAQEAREEEGKEEDAGEHEHPGGEARDDADADLAARMRRGEAELIGEPPRQRTGG